MSVKNLGGFKWRFSGYMQTINYQTVKIAQVLISNSMYGHVFHKML